MRDLIYDEEDGVYWPRGKNEKIEDALSPSGKASRPHYKAEDIKRLIHLLDCERNIDLAIEWVTSGSDYSLGQFLVYIGVISEEDRGGRCPLGEAVKEK